MSNDMKSGSSDAEQVHPAEKRRVSKLPTTVSAPCGRVVSNDVLGREPLRNDGEMCGSRACYAVYIRAQRVRSGPNPNDAEGSTFVQLLTCEHHREPAKEREFL